MFTPSSVFAYSKLKDNEKLTDTEIVLMKKAKRWVIFLAFFQLTMAIFSANLLQWILAAVFVPLGVVGASRSRPKMLVAHFVYSVFEYILSLIGIVWLILYCDDCSWAVYLIAFLIILIQAIGMRHSRILIALVKIQEALSLPTINNVSVQEQQQIELQIQQSLMEQQQPQQQEEQQQQQFPQQPYPQQVYYAIPMPYGQQQGMAPQYYPVPMPLAYPLMHAQQQQEQPVVVPQASIYPSVYKQ